MNERLSNCDNAAVSKCETTDELEEMFGECPPGALVFIEREETLVIKVKGGWKQVMVKRNENEVVRCKWKVFPFFSDGSICERLRHFPPFFYHTILDQV